VRGSTLKVSPDEQFSGHKLDAKLDLRTNFGDFAHVNVRHTSNDMSSRTIPCIAVMPLHNGCGSVKWMSLETLKRVTGDHFTLMPTPQSVCEYITALALSEGFTRTGYKQELDQSLAAFDVPDGDSDPAPEALPRLPEMMPIDGRADVLPSASSAEAPGSGVIAQNPAKLTPESVVPPSTDQQPSEEDETWGEEAAGYAPPRRSPRLLKLPAERIPQVGEIDRHEEDAMINLARAIAHSDLKKIQDEDRACLRRHLHHRRNWRDSHAMLNVSVKQAIRERGEEARTVITAELAQILEKEVWHGVHLKGLTKEERKAVLRSKMFLKDKFTASGA
jgi:hypothetical protein